MEMVKAFTTKNPAQTKKLGEILAVEILKTKPSKKAMLLALEGELGSGKTTFIQGFAKGLGINQKILSPTFILIKCFTGRDPQSGMRREMRRSLSDLQVSSFKNFYHIDCYRLKKPKEILDLGFKEIITSPQNIVAVEWAERIRKILPKGIISLKFKLVDSNTRKISINIPKGI